MSDLSMPDARQEVLDTFYHQHGPCCAGCDWWHSWSTATGECRRSAMVSGAERMAAIGIVNCSMPLSAGHVLTEHKHVCGEFKDEFDWTTLPLPYRKRIGNLSPYRRALDQVKGEGGGDAEA